MKGVAARWGEQCETGQLWHFAYIVATQSVTMWLETMLRLSRDWKISQKVLVIESIFSYGERAEISFVLEAEYALLFCKHNGMTLCIRAVWEARK